MYVLRHFASVMIYLARCAFSLRFRFCGAWLWDLLVWLDDSLRLVFCRSRRVECDCCGWQGNRFFLLTIISGPRVYRFREICPRCQAVERQRQLVRHLKDETQVLSLNSPTILHIGPSKAVTDWFRRQGLTNIVTIDLRSGVAMLRMDIIRLAFKDDTFDVIVCSHVLEHVPSDLVAMREMLRVMKARGMCVIQIPMQPGLPKTVEYGEPKPEEHDHVRAYGQDFASRLNSVGFKITCSEDELFEVTKPRSTAEVA